MSIKSLAASSRFESVCLRFDLLFNGPQRYPPFNKHSVGSRRGPSAQDSEHAE